MRRVRILTSMSLPLMMWLMTPVAALSLPAAAKADEPPSAELLEFLGNWETADGEWQDPLELMKELAVAEGDSQTVKVEDGHDEQ